jgi:hypothetical protein
MLTFSTSQAGWVVADQAETGFTDDFYWQSGSLFFFGGNPYAGFCGRISADPSQNPFCGNGSCDAGETPCNCAADCGMPPSNELAQSTCADGVDNDCDGYADCADPDCAGDAVACPNGRIPTVSDWGMLVLALLTLTAGTLVVLRGRVAA